MGFEPRKIEPDIWLRHCGEDHYENIAVYADGLLIASKDTKVILDVLINKHSFKLKGAGPISHNICCDFGRDDNGTLQFATKNMSTQWLIDTATWLELNPISPSHYL